MKHIVCYSGGHSSALVAIEVVRKYGKDDVILMNHNITSKVEHEDIKRFKREVAQYLGMKITYENMKDWETKTPLEVCLEASAWKIGQKNAICTSRMKTEPFHRFLAREFTVEPGEIRDDVIIYYGFDANEGKRITRKVGIMASMGYKTAYPLADPNWERTIHNTEDTGPMGSGIQRPITYELFKHANCFPCLKAGMQHWFMLYCFDYDEFVKHRDAEDIIGYSIIKDHYLKDIECKFKAMKDLMIEPTEKLHHNTFWSRAKKALEEEFGDLEAIPCDCSF